jgi:hypothetical protein
MLVFCLTICDFNFCAAERKRLNVNEIKERKLIGWKNARPQPDLLPRGEGTATAHFWFCGGLSGKFSHRYSGEMADVSPSPWGEGRVEGGCEF